MATSAPRPRYADPHRCPRCGGPLPGPVCPACGLELVGPAATELWRVCTELDRLEAERARLVGVLAAEQAERRAAWERQVRERAVTRPPAWQPVLPAPGLPAPGPVRRGLGVQTVLVGLGALLLSVAAVIFLFFSWGSLGVTGRSVVIATGTLAVLAGAAVAARLRLRATAEAVGALGVVLVLLDVWAVRRTGLAGAGLSASAYAAAGVAVAGVVLAAWGLPARVRAGTVAAAGLLPLTPALAGVAAAGPLDGRWEVASLAAGLAAGSAVGAVRGLPPVRPLALERVVLAVAGAGLLLAAGLVSVVSRLEGGPGLAALLLVLTATVAGVHAVVGRAGAALGAWSASVGVSGAAAAAMAATALPTSWPLAAAPAAAGALAVALRLAAGSLPAWRDAVAWAGRAALGVCAVAALPAAGLWALTVGVLAVAPAVPWSREAGDPVGGLLAGVLGEQVPARDAVAGVVAVAVLALTALGWRRAAGRPWAATVAAGLAVAALLAVPVLPVLRVDAAVAGLVALAVGCAVVGALLAARGLGQFAVVVLTGAWTAGLAGVLLAWSVETLAVPATAAGVAGLLVARRRWTPLGPALLAVAATATVVAAVAAALSAGARPVPALEWGAIAAAVVAGLAALAPDRALRPPVARVDRGALLLAGSGAFALVVVLLVEATGADVPVSVPGAGLVAAAVVAVDPWRRVATGGRSVATAAGVALAAATAATAARELDVLEAPAAVAVTAALGLVLSAALARSASPLRHAAEPASAVTGAVAVLGSAATGAGPAWFVLAVLAAGALAVATVPDRRAAGWGALVLGTASLWLRLEEGRVDLLEAFTLPPAAVLLAVAGWRRRWRSTDPVLAGGLALAVAPTALAGVSGAPWRAVAVTAVATAAVAAAEWSRRAGAGATRLLLAVTAGAALAGPWLRGLRDAVDGGPFPEVWVLPAAALVLAAGVVGRQPTGWTVAAASALAGVPTLAAGHPDGLVARPAAVVVAGAVLAVAATWLGARTGDPRVVAGLALAALGVVTGWPLVRPQEVLVVVLGLALLAIGVLHLHRNRALRSWPALGPGLALLLLPPLLLAAADPAPWRVGALAVVAAGVVAAGAWRGWQAPLVLGGAVLAVHAVTQTWTELVALYEAVPRWLSLGAAGAVLLALGARYERRVRDLRTLQERVTAMR